jgi:hypothetical protein
MLSLIALMDILNNIKNTTDETSVLEGQESVENVNES